MVKKHTERIVTLAIDTGALLLSHGAETYRVEDTLNIMCKSRGLKNVDSFVTPTGIFLSVADEEDHYTLIRRIKVTGIDLHMIENANDFARRFASGELDYDEALLAYQEFAGGVKYSLPIQVLSGGLSAGFFSLLFKGSILDTVIALIVGALLRYFIIVMRRYELGFFINNFLGSFLMAGAVILFNRFIDFGTQAVIVACMMQLVPGVAITNFIRDSISGDFLSGISRGSEALFIAMAIAFGVGIAYMFF